MRKADMRKQKISEAYWMPARRMWADGIPKALIARWYGRSAVSFRVTTQKWQRKGRGWFPPRSSDYIPPDVQRLLCLQQTVETRREALLREIAEQKRWIADHGGSLEGYIRLYGDPGVPSVDANDDVHFGDGGTAIWNADNVHLRQLESELEFYDINAANEAATSEQRIVSSDQNPPGE